MPCRRAPASTPPITASGSSAYLILCTPNNIAS